MFASHCTTSVSPSSVESLRQATYRKDDISCAPQPVKQHRHRIPLRVRSCAFPIRSFAKKVVKRPLFDLHFPIDLSTASRHHRITAISIDSNLSRQTNERVSIYLYSQKMSSAFRRRFTIITCTIIMATIVLPTTTDAFVPTTTVNPAVATTPSAPALDTTHTGLTLTWERDAECHIREMLTERRATCVEEDVKTSPLMISICGIPGSGKSTCAEILGNFVQDSGCLVFPRVSIGLNVKELCVCLFVRLFVRCQDTPFLTRLLCLKQNRMVITIPLPT